MSQAVNHRWRAFGVAAAIASLTIMDLSKINTGLPAIEGSLGATSTQLQLVVSGYVLTFGLALVPAGRLGDQRSRKTLFIIGLAVFTTMSVVAGLAVDPTMLVIARLAQGIGAGIQMPQVMGTIQELFQGAERGRALGLFGAVIGLATAIGPTAGGLLIAAGGPEWGWRLVFLVNLPLGIAAIIATILLLPSSPKRHSREPLHMDPVGILIFTVVIVSLMWPFLFTTGRPTDDPNRWWVLLVFALTLAIFVWWEDRYSRSGRQPLIPLRLFRNSAFRNSVIVSSLYFAALPTMFVLTTVFLQDGLHVTAVVAGMTTITFAVASAGTSYWGGLLVGRYGRPIVITGLAIVLASLILLVVSANIIPPELIPWAVTVIMLFAGAGGGFVISPNQTLMLSTIDVKEGGLAGSVGQLGQRVGTAIGSAVGLSLFYAVTFREDGMVPASRIPFDAYSTGMLAAAVILALALLAAVVDLIGHGRGRMKGASLALD